mmetsp:Transcript_917/g.2838  ORF Transcript_917/g.2838 Transcript_917/m.2838 type:complete len:218 (+) Transcript_917:206-859(+)
MPSPVMRSTSPGRVTPSAAMVTMRPSRCSISLRKPRRASRSVSVSAARRWFPSRVKRGCGFSRSTRTTSPGICLGRCSDMRSKVISMPAAMPRSMTASSVVSSSLHFSLEGTSSCCCTNMPAPTWRCTVRTSPGHRPHLAQRSRLASVSAREQPRHTTRRRMRAATLPPLYMSSRDTSRFIRTSGPLLPRPRPPPPPPPHLETGPGSPGTGGRACRS